jgi:hypothetical protein
MGVNITTRTERTICFGLGAVTFCEESGTVRFGVTGTTTNARKVREFAKVLEDVAVMMENCEGNNGAD